MADESSFFVLCSDPDVREEVADQLKALGVDNVVR